MKSLLSILVFLPLFLKASTDTLPAIDTAALQELYGIISHRQAAISSDGWHWAHRRVIYKSLGIDSSRINDSLTGTRLRFGWQQLQHFRISKNSEPPYYFNDVLRLAIHHGYGPLLLDAVRWKVDINSFDPVMHNSLLDYLEEEYQNGDGEKRLNWLREYKKILESAGAVYFGQTDFYIRNLSKKYDRIRPPVDGLYPVQKKNRWGWVTQKNQPVIPFRYKAVRFFTGEWFEVSDDGIHYYIINRKQQKIH